MRVPGTAIRPLHREAQLEWRLLYLDESIFDSRMLQGISPKQQKQPRQAALEPPSGQAA
jgi:hypothetical protein